VNSTEPTQSFTYPIVEQYANNNALWIREFSRVCIQIIYFLLFILVINILIKKQIDTGSNSN